MLKVKLPNTGQTEWTTEWPKTEGVYWFYGYPWGMKYASKDRDPDLLCVLVRNVSNGRLYITEGYTLENDAIGVWTPVILPDNPGKV